MRSTSKIALYIVLLICLCNISCNKFSLEIVNRKYRPGFYVDLSLHKNPSSNQSASSRLATGNQHASKWQAAVQKKVIPITKSSDQHHTAYYGKDQKIDQKRITRTNARLSNNDNRKLVAVDENKPIKAQRTQLVENINSGEPNRKNTSVPFWIAGLTAFISSGLLLSNRKRALQVSRWSARNSKLSLPIQVIGHMALALGSFIAGSMLFNHDVVMTPVTAGVFTSVFLGILAIYPTRKRGQIIFQPAYRKIKLLDIAYIISGAMICTTLGNQVASERFTASRQPGIELTQSQIALAKISEGADKLDAALFKTDNEGAKEKLSVGQVILLVFIPVVFAILTLLLAALSCFIACEGNGGVAALVFVLGLALLIMLSILATKAVMKMQRSKKTPAADESK